MEHCEAEEDEWIEEVNFMAYQILYGGLSTVGMFNVTNMTKLSYKG